MINATDNTAARRHSDERQCPTWCTAGPDCWGDHYGQGHLVSASLYGCEGDGRTEVNLGAVQEDMAEGRPGASLSLGQFLNDGSEDGFAVFLTVSELRQLCDAAQSVLSELEEATR